MLNLAPPRSQLDSLPDHAVDGDRQPGCRARPHPQTAHRPRSARASRRRSSVHVSPEPGAPAKLARAAADDRHTISSPAAATVTVDRGRRRRGRHRHAGLAIVPTGAGNDFARVLGYDPKRPLDAFGVLAHGRDRVVDLGRVNGRWYTCVDRSGFDAEANRWANTVQRLSGTTLYVAAVLRTLAVYRPHRFRLTVDGDTPRNARVARRRGQRPRVRGRDEDRARRSSRRRPARRHRRRRDAASRSSS